MKGSGGHIKATVGSGQDIFTHERIKTLKEHQRTQLKRSAAISPFFCLSLISVKIVSLLGPIIFIFYTYIRHKGQLHSRFHC